MQIERRKIESSLVSKGFVKDDTHHKYFYHEYQGLRTGLYTYTSHGSKYKTYGMPLLKRMKKELKLDAIKQAIDLFECPMTKHGYNQILKDKGLLESE